LGWLDRSVAEAQSLRLSGRLVELVSLSPVDDLERMTYRGEIRRLEADVASLTKAHSIPAGQFPSERSVAGSFGSSARPITALGKQRTPSAVGRPWLTTT